LEAIYRKKHTVHISDVDFSRKLKLSTMFVYFQDMATEHAEKLGVGRDVLLKDNLIWVLASVRADIERYPVWNENIFVETWPLQPDKINFERDFLVYDENNDIIARAVTNWVIIDMNSRRLKRSKVINSEFPEAGRERSIDCSLGRINASGSMSEVYRKTVGYSDIDMNEHLNNSKYLDYIMDCFTIENHKNYFTKSIEVNYIHEALPGDTIILSKGIDEVNDGTVYVEGINESSNSAVFKSRLKVQEKRIISI